MLSHSRWSAAAISTGCTALRNARAKAPEIICSSFVLEVLESTHGPPPSVSAVTQVRPDASVDQVSPDRIGAGPRPRPTHRRPQRRDAPGFGEARGAGIALPRFTREWRNRQTRTVQVRVSERTWGFNSPLAHASDRPRVSDPGPRHLRSSTEGLTEPAPHPIPSKPAPNPLLARSSPIAADRGSSAGDRRRGLPPMRFLVPHPRGRGGSLAGLTHRPPRQASEAGVDARIPKWDALGTMGA